MKLKQITKLDDYLMKNKLYRWCKKEDVKSIINKVRSLKQKLSHDNLFDISIGAILALIGLYWYMNDADMSKLIIIALPALVSWFNELINVWQVAKIGWIDIMLRLLIPSALYLII